MRKKENMKLWGKFLIELRDFDDELANRLLDEGVMDTDFNKFKVEVEKAKRSMSDGRLDPDESFLLEWKGFSMTVVGELGLKDITCSMDYLDSEIH